MVNLTMCQCGLKGVALDPFTQATKTNGERDERVNVIRMGYLYTCWCNLLKNPMYKLINFKMEINNAG